MSALSTTLVRADERPIHITPPQTQVRQNRSRRFPTVSILAGGLAILATAGLTLTSVARSDAGVRDMGPVPASVATGSLAVTLSGPDDVTVLHQTYEPGKDSGWHAHPGIHAVAVLSGTLTIYDEVCQVHTFGPGQSYVGGQQTHLVRNETAEPVDMVVTYLNPAGPHDSNRRMQPPAGCAS